MEIHGLGAAILIDTPGIDDDTLLGSERVSRIGKGLDKTDIAVVLLTDESCDAEKTLIEQCRIREIPTVAALAHIDRINDYPTLQRSLSQQLGSRRTMDTSIHATAAQKRTVGGIDNGIHFQFSDVGGYYFNHVIVQLLGISENDVQCFFGKQFSLLQNLFKAFFERFLVHRMHNFFCNYDAF